MTMAANALDLLADLIARARAAGADAADAVLVSGTSLSVQRRLGKTEHVERSEGQDLGLRVFQGQQAAIVSSSTVAPSSFKELAERAVAMARVVPEDPYSGLADTAAPPEPVALDMEDASEPATEALVARAAAAEDAALAVPGITNSEGAEAGFGRSEVFLVTSAGFAGRLSRTSHSVSASAIAGAGTRMQRDYDYHSTVHLADLDDPSAIGRSAAERAITRLNPARPSTAKLPVIYDPRVAGGLLGHLAGAINGASVARGTTFLKDKLGQRIFAPGIAIRDDPRRVRGLRSRPFDGEGTPTAARALIDDGVLTTWLLDSRSARQLGLRSTGHAARGTGGPPSPSPTNLYLDAGRLTAAELMADIKLGLYVTELIGMGVNGLTGDYSRGAAGFMIRDGAIAEPVAEITVAGNLLDMFASLVPANDLRFRRGTDSPTVRVDGMTMAGG
jgi:PmbA protein